jgi:hypothetical protein
MIPISLQLLVFLAHQKASLFQPESLRLALQILGSER